MNENMVAGKFAFPFVNKAPATNEDKIIIILTLNKITCPSGNENEAGGLNQCFCRLCRDVGHTACFEHVKNEPNKMEVLLKA